MANACFLSFNNFTFVLKFFGKYFRVFIFLGLGLFLLWWVTRSLNINLIILEIKKANYFWIFAAIFFGVASHYIRALRWNILIRSLGFKVKAFSTFRAVMAGYLANLVVPRLGEVSKCAVLSKENGIPFNSLAGTMIAERFIDMITLALLIFFTITLQLSFLKEFLNDFFFEPLKLHSSSNLLIVFLAGAFLLAATIILFIILRKKLRNSQPGTFSHKLHRQLRGFANGVKTLWRMKRKGWFIFYSFLIWGFYFLTVYLCFFAIGATSHLSPMAGLTLLAVGSLGILAPVPGGIGTYHFITIATLTRLYHIAPEPATSYAYLSHAMQMVLVVGTGGVLWLIYSFGGSNSKKPENYPPMQHLA